MSAALRKIAAGAADGVLTGEYAGKIHGCAADLARDMDKVASRYEKASAALARWVPDLEYAQALSLRALNQAEAPYSTLQILTVPQVPARGNPTLAQEQDMAAYQRISARAQSALEEARALLARAVGFRDEQAARCAAAINAASDDTLADYWVFGLNFPGMRKAGALLEQAASGDTRALVLLLVMQKAAASPDLASAVSAWWQLLSSGMREKLIAEEPAVIGWLDGLPAPVRDVANRDVFWADYVRLEAEKTRLEAELRGATSGILGIPGIGSLINDVDGTGARQAELAHIEGILNGMAAIIAVLCQPDRGLNVLPPVYLLGFDANDLGHCIVSIGNPDTANNVVTYVPGLGSGFPSTIPGDLRRTSLLWQQTHRFDPGAMIASIYWLGYNAPQLDLKLSASALLPSALSEDAAVASTADAKAGAPALDSFAAGLAAAHDPAFTAHTVMLGHSYGSLVVGEAAVRWPGKLAQDLVFVGSPGVGVNKAFQLGVPADHIFAGEAANDPVPRLPPDNLPEWLFGNDDSSHFGTNPATPQFGGRDFYVAPGHPITVTDLIGAHSQYWDPNSVSLRNLARIVDGLYSKIQWAAP
jgi:hypothetical protein